MKAKEEPNVKDSPPSAHSTPISHNYSSRNSCGSRVSFSTSVISSSDFAQAYPKDLSLPLLLLGKPFSETVASQGPSRRELLALFPRKVECHARGLNAKGEFLWSPPTLERERDTLMMEMEEFFKKHQPTTFTFDSLAEGRPCLVSSSEGKWVRAKVKRVLVTDEVRQKLPDPDEPGETMAFEMDDSEEKAVPEPDECREKTLPMPAELGEETEPGRDERKEEVKGFTESAVEKAPVGLVEVYLVDFKEETTYPIGSVYRLPSQFASLPPLCPFSARIFGTRIKGYLNPKNLREEIEREVKAARQGQVMFNVYVVSPVEPCPVLAFYRDREERRIFPNAYFWNPARHADPMDELEVTEVTKLEISLKSVNATIGGFDDTMVFEEQDNEPLGKAVTYTPPAVKKAVSRGKFHPQDRIIKFPSGLDFSPGFEQDAIVSCYRGINCIYVKTPEQIVQTLRIEAVLQAQFGKRDRIPKAEVKKGTPCAFEHPTLARPVRGIVVEVLGEEIEVQAVDYGFKFNLPLDTDALYGLFLAIKDLPIAPQCVCLSQDTRSMPVTDQDLLEKETAENCAVGSTVLFRVIPGRRRNDYTYYAAINGNPQGGLVGDVEDEPREEVETPTDLTTLGFRGNSSEDWDASDEKTSSVTPVEQKECKMIKKEESKKPSGDDAPPNGGPFVPQQKLGALVDGVCPENIKTEFEVVGTGTIAVSRKLDKFGRPITAVLAEKDKKCPPQQQVNSSPVSNGSSSKSATTADGIAEKLNSGRESPQSRARAKNSRRPVKNGHGRSDEASNYRRHKSLGRDQGVEWSARERRGSRSQSRGPPPSVLPKWKRLLQTESGIAQATSGMSCRWIDKQFKAIVTGVLPDSGIVVLPLESREMLNKMQDELFSKRVFLEMNQWNDIGVGGDPFCLVKEGEEYFRGRVQYAWEDGTYCVLLVDSEEIQEIVYPHEMFSLPDHLYDHPGQCVVMYIRHMPQRFAFASHQERETARQSVLDLLVDKEVTIRSYWDVDSRRINITSMQDEKGNELRQACYEIFQDAVCQAPVKHFVRGGGRNHARQ